MPWLLMYAIPELPDMRSRYANGAGSLGMLFGITVEAP
jgi:hypothetical protein